MFTAKFKVYSVTDLGNDNKQIVMLADTSKKSDYAKFTPSGKIEFNCTNPDVNRQISPGNDYLITFENVTPVSGE